MTAATIIHRFRYHIGVAPFTPFAFLHLLHPHPAPKATSHEQTCAWCSSSQRFLSRCVCSAVVRPPLPVHRGCGHLRLHVPCHVCIGADVGAGVTAPAHP